MCNFNWISFKTQSLDFKVVGNDFFPKSTPGAVFSRVATCIIQIAEAVICGHFEQIGHFQPIGTDQMDRPLSHNC